ncbi:hypothetical protein ACHQM5_028347 [Ranunculus cassubicifolius]
MIFKAISRCWEQTTGHDEHTRVALLLSALLLAIGSWLVSKRNTKKKVLLPPGPWGLPIVGNLPFLAGQDLHNCFAQLSHKYGPVMRLQLGSRLSVVISSPDTAKQVLKDHDSDFADRDIPVADTIASYGGMDIGFAPQGVHWRMLRRLCARKLLNHGNLEALYELRRGEVRNMVTKVYSKIGSSVDIGGIVLFTCFNIITDLMWGNTLAGEEKRHVSAQLLEALQKLIDLLGEVNISDFFPVLAPFDLQGKARQVKEIMERYDQIFKFVIEKRKTMEKGASPEFLQALLQHEAEGDQETPLTETHLKALFVDLILAGTKTTTNSVEFAIAELLHQPELMKKVQDELDEVVGLNQVVEESHLPQLPYLEATVREVLRLHPAGPLLVPHLARASNVVGGYLIPKGAKIFVNAWAIHRDPKYWNDASEFQPERFLNSNMDGNCSGNDFRFIPFGAGRRSCIGKSLAVKMFSHLLATLLHSFNWELPQGVELDLSEKFSIDLRLKVPLVVFPSPRLSDAGLYCSTTPQV